MHVRAQMIDAAIVVRAHNIVEDTSAWVITALARAVCSLLFVHSLVAFDTVAHWPSENAKVPHWTILDTIMAIARRVRSTCDRVHATCPAPRQRAADAAAGAQRVAGDGQRARARAALACGTLSTRGHRLVCRGLPL